MVAKILAVLLIGPPISIAIIIEIISAMKIGKAMDCCWRAFSPLNKPTTNWAMNAPIQYLINIATTNVTINGMIKNGIKDFKDFGNLHVLTHLHK
jgi:hypothetical protein